MSSSAMTIPPTSSAGVQGENQPRSMRLKVSYTFDDESKSNCLARYPHPISTRAIQMDKDLLVGAVEFKTCILSMISSSPELVANLSQDYSVYAYDYSEQGIPLVGCGLLSWAMTAVNNQSNGSQNSAPARHMITGRISSNKYGFFCEDEVKETLEVKFKLMPVQTFTQAQFVQSVHTYNALSKVIPGGFNASAWTNYLNQHPNILAPPTHPLSASEPLQSQSRTLDKSMLAETEKGRSKKSSRDGNATSSEENGEPPKKKVRNYSGRVRKPSSGSRKKATAALPPPPLSPIPELFPSPAETFKEPLDIPQDATPQPPEVPAETTVRPSLSFNDMLSPENENSPAPQTVNSAIMASSPPIAPEETAEEISPEFSPEPPSPILPSPPPNEDIQNISQEYHQDLECLFDDTNFEDVKPDVTNIASPSLELPAPPIPPIDQEIALLTALNLPTTNRLSTIPDDMTETAAASPSTLDEAPKPKPKPKRKYPKKAKSVVDPGSVNSDAVASSDIGEDGGRKIKRSKSEKAARTAANVKERIHAQMLAAIEQGKMPNFCMNCGAIETPTWRKVSMKDDSEELEVEGDAKAKKDKDLLLCNPCGLWYGSHKTMRPQDYWDGKKEEPAPKRPRPKKKKALPTPAASSQPVGQPSEVCIEPIVVPDEDEEELPMLPPQLPVQKMHSKTPKGNRSIKGSHPDWEAASIASRRVVQSSPAKRGLSADSPIDLEADSNAQSPRRLLFPVKVTPNCSSIRKALNLGNATYPRGLGSELEKENRVPDATSGDGNENQRLSTPIKKRGVSLQPRTPLSSPMKLGKLGSPSPWNSDIFASGEKRKASGSLAQAISEEQITHMAAPASLSPTSQLLEKIMSMADPSAIPIDLGVNIPDDLPRPSPIDTAGGGFDFCDNIFETDMTMPSSPPLFNLDNMEDEVNSWGGFLPSSPSFNGMDYGLDIFEDMGIVAPLDGESMKSEKCCNAEATPEEATLAVDFSSYIDEATKNLVAGN